MRSRIGCLVLALVGAGCDGPSGPGFLMIDAIDPAVASEGDALELHGRAIGRGEALEVRVEGEAVGPAGVRREVSVRLPAERASEHAVTASLAPLFEAVGGRATIRGFVEVSVRGSTGAIVEGRRDLDLDLVSGGRGAWARESDAEAWLERLGITLDVEAEAAEGLLVAAVGEGSIAAEMGLVAGDRLVGLGGLRLLSVSDFVPPRSLAPATLEAFREGEPSTRRIVLPVGAASPVEAPPLAWVLLVVMLLVVVLFLAPTARLTQWLADAPVAHDEGTLRWLFGARSPGTGRGRRFALLAGGVLAMSAAFAGLPVVGRALAPTVGVGVLMTTALTLRFVARATSPTGSGSIGGFLGRGAPIVLCVASVTTLLGTGHLDTVQRAQGASPWEWLVFSNPIAFALFPAFACAVLAGIDTDDRDGAVAAVATRAHLIVVSGLGVVLFLGGFRPFEGGSAILGILAFVAKAWALLFVGLWLRRIAPELHHRAWRWATIVGMLAFPASALWSAFEPPAALERAFGLALASVAAAFLAFVLVSRARRPGPPTLRLHPFL